MILDHPAVLITLIVVGAATLGIMAPIIYYAVARPRRLKRENKYYINVQCVSCTEYNYFEIPRGTCSSDFLLDEKCRHCACPFKHKAQSEQRNDYWNGPSK